MARLPRSVLLDTNIVVAYFARERAVLARLRQARHVSVPATVIGELLFGAYNSGQAEANTARVEDFAAKSTVLGCDTVTARHYAQIRLELRKKGRPIPDNDLWIAALARQHNLVLVSRDAHFGHVDHLLVETWS